MAQMYTELSDKHSEFIAAQKMYFVGTATADSRINVSPKGMDSLRLAQRHRQRQRNLGACAGRSTHDGDVLRV
jgi:predicted pyridoxine 5'-phosphate oxidase superfamily flavin-nucleotide-binding protein